MTPELGIIEGFYGPLWRWSERRHLLSLLAPAGYGFYLYAPKADESLRKDWRTPFGKAQLKQMADFSNYCQTVGVRFGVGLSPIGALGNFDQARRQCLSDKLKCLDDIGIQDLAILFDDIPIDLPDLAARQVELVHWAQTHTAASRVILCPSYYSDDPVLDRIFGPRPDRYLEQLGEMLDPAIAVFWAGEEVCSRAMTTGHLEDVSRRLRRLPFLWDNYPVNDGPRMCNHLHLRGFTGRPAAIANHIAAHGINPALQPVLSCIPALALADAYSAGDDYRYMQASRRAMARVLGDSLGARVMEDLALLQDTGLDRLGPAQVAVLRGRYEGNDHAAAREIVQWLNGAYVTAMPIP